MIISALLLAASTISLPKFDVLGVENYIWKKFDLYKLTPQDPALGVTVNLWIEPHGRITSCWIGRMVGNKEAAKGLCPILVGMYTIPARDERHKRTYGLVSLNFIVGPHASNESAQDIADTLHSMVNAGNADERLSIDNNQLTTKTHQTIIVQLAPDGSVQACGTSEGASALPTDLLEQACASAKTKKFVVRRGKANEPVSYVREVELVPIESK